MELEPRTTAPAHATGAVEFVPLAEIAEDATFQLRQEGDVAALAASIGRLGHLVPIELRPLPGAPEGPPRYQVVAGFRRIAALRLLARDRVLARVHGTLDDEDAWAIALAQALLGEPLVAGELETLRERLREGRFAPWAQELVDEALVRVPVDPAERERFLEFLARPPEEAEPEPAGEEPFDEARPEEEVFADAEADEEPSEEEAESEVEAAAEAYGDAEDVEVTEVTPEELAIDIAERLSALNQDLALAFDAWAELPEEGRRMIVEQARYVAELFPHLRTGRR
jgi:ParB-like chromosome segregation protein Spo0J